MTPPRLTLAQACEALGGADPKAVTILARRHGIGKPPGEWSFAPRDVERLKMARRNKGGRPKGTTKAALEARRGTPRKLSP